MSELEIAIYVFLTFFGLYILGIVLWVINTYLYIMLKPNTYKYYKIFTIYDLLNEVEKTPAYIPVVNIMGALSLFIVQIISYICNFIGLNLILNRIIKYLNKIWDKILNINLYRNCDHFN